MDCHATHTRSCIAGTLFLATVFALSFTLPSCGEKMKEAQQTMENLKSISENAEKAQEQGNEGQKLRDQRRAKGDTMAIPYKELQKFLPESVSGYTAAEPTGQSVDMMGMSYSTVSRRYTRPGANGEEAVEITLIDYNATAALYEGAAAFMALGMNVDSDNETTKTYKMNYPASGGMETYHKKDKRSELKYALAGRFWLEVKADNQSSIEGVKAIANSMKISELASK